MDQSALLSSYHTRLNALLQRVKSIEILLMNREEEIEREDFSSWKEAKAQKLAMLQSIYDQQVAAKKEELEDLRQTQQVELEELHPAQQDKPSETQSSQPAQPAPKAEPQEISQAKEPAKEPVKEPAKEPAVTEAAVEVDSSDDDDL